MGGGIDIIGVWELARWGRIRGNGPLMPFGPEARGRLIYDASGIMSAHLERSSTRLPDATQVYSYSGRWRIEGRTAFHEVDLANIPEWIGTTLTRTVLLLDTTRLKLETPPVAARSGALRDVLEWVRGSAAAA
jgi:hypothetical protein